MPLVCASRLTAPCWTGGRRRWWDGRPSFQALQHRAAHPRHSIVSDAFDLLHLNGEDLTWQPLEHRKAQLSKVVDGSGILLSHSLPGSATQVIEAVQRLGSRGDCEAEYLPLQRGSASRAWVKLKLDKQQEFVIGGDPPGPHGVDALLVGYYEARKLRFAGKVAGWLYTARSAGGVRAPEAAARCELPVRGSPQQQNLPLGSGVTAEQMERCSGSP